jgi:molybdopterin converting factor small subunit
MADATSDATVTLEFHGALADRFLPLGVRHGARTRVRVEARPVVRELLLDLSNLDRRYAYLFNPDTGSLPEHVEVVLNDRVIELQGGLNAPLRDGDVLAFLPAHAGG